MKKFMLLATAVGMTLTSCVNEVETPVESGRQVIAFDAPVMKNTRAVVKGEITDNTYPALVSQSAYFNRLPSFAHPLTD